MNAKILDYLPTETQLDHFSEQGFLIIPNALDESQCDHLETLVDAIWTEQKAQGLKEEGNLFYPNFVGRDQSFIDLLDHPATFPAVWSILGWNIYLYHSHLGVTPQEAQPSDPMKLPLGFHQDSGRVNGDLQEASPRPRISLKVGFFLSDVSEEGRGNFHVVPGSHLENNLQKYDDRNPDGAIPVCVNRGDAVFFDRRLWHARSPNHSSIVRKVLFYGYGYRWIRTKDDTTIRPDLFRNCNPIRRQLLGDGTNCNGYFSPKDKDVPLKVWLEENLETVQA
jgi:ectoine hydroxylase-related dioxygenase (phytanoyl-CoA dioxygenase family)